MKRILNKKYNLDNGIIRYFLLIIIALLVIAIFLTIFCCSNNEGNTSWWCSHLATTIIFITAITALLVQKSLKENIQKIIAPTLLMIALIGVSAAICNSPQNPSLYAMSVTMSAPALLFFIREKRKIVRFTALCLFIICFFCVAKSNSRTGCIAMVISTFFILPIFIKIRIKLFVSIAFIIIMCVTGILFFTKADSSLGRKFILERSIDMILEKPRGWGIGGFESDYMEFQAAYFEHNNDEVAEILADDIKHPLNEFVKIAVDYGIITLILIIPIIAIVLYKLYSHKDRFCNIAFHFSLILLVWCCFSYPLSTPFVQLLIWVYALPCIIKTKKIINRKGVKIIIGIVLIISTCIEGKATIDDCKWNAAIDEYQKGNIDKAMRVFQKYDSYLIDKGKLLYSLATIEYNNKNYAQCIEICKKCKLYISSYEFEIMIANSYMLTNDFINAEKHYIKAEHMCPNRFIPLYQRFKIYREKGEWDKMLALGNIILNKRIKIPSRKIDIILNNVKYELQKNELLN